MTGADLHRGLDDDVGAARALFPFQLPSARVGEAGDALLVRLVMFSTMIAATSATATLTARDRQFSWLAGSIILAVSIPPHLYPGHVWDYYPSWYHIVELVSIVPTAVLAGRLTTRFIPENRKNKLRFPHHRY